MAERRMFAKSIVSSDAFLDMPTTTQALYFHLGMQADDDGFVDCPRKIQRSLGCSDDDLKLLLAKKFVLAFDSGVIVIRHWRAHNYIQKDRYKATVYCDEKSQLTTDENGVYAYLCKEAETGMYTRCIQPVSKMDTQVRLRKESKPGIGVLLPCRALIQIEDPLFFVCGHNHQIIGKLFDTAGHVNQSSIRNFNIFAKLHFYAPFS